MSLCRLGVKRKVLGPIPPEIPMRISGFGDQGKDVYGVRASYIQLVVASQSIKRHFRTLVVFFKV